MATLTRWSYTSLRAPSRRAIAERRPVASTRNRARTARDADPAPARTPSSQPPSIHSQDARRASRSTRAPAASAALSALDRGDVEGYRAEMAPTLPLSRHIFCAPTFYYKTGIAFLAWLSGHQDGFGMVGGSMRYGKRRTRTSVKFA